MVRSKSTSLLIGQLLLTVHREASGDLQLRERVLDLRIAIEKATDCIQRNETAVGPSRSLPSPVYRSLGPLTMDNESVISAKSERSHSWRPTFRPRGSKSDDASSRSSRTPSIMTTSSAASNRTASTAASETSGTSRTGPTTVSDSSDHKRSDSTNLPYSQKSSDRPGSKDAASEAVRPSLTAQHRHSDSKVVTSDRPTPANTLAVRPRSEAKAQEFLGLKRTETVKPIVRPTAEVEMSSGKYQGYWRANFATSIPAAAAISASTILATAITTGGERALMISPELHERAALLRDNLDMASSAQDTMHILQTSDLGALIFTLRHSLDEGQCPQIPTKTAASMYQRIDEMGGQPHKAAKAWKEIAKLLKKIPEQTLVYLLFLVHIGRRLQGRKITIDRKPAVVFLLRSFWPKVDPKVAHPAAGDVVSVMLLDHFEDIPEELPVGLEAVRYQFQSGGRGDLLSLISQNRNVIEKRNRKASTATDAS